MTAISMRSLFPAALALLAGVAQAAPVDVTTGATDTAAAQLLGDGSTDLYTNFPGAESPAQAIDDNTGTKYLSFQGAGLDDNGNLVSNPTGFVVVLTTPSAISAVQFTTANDFASRDPSMVKIFGTNKVGTATEIAADGVSSDYTLVYDGPTGVPVETFADEFRFTEGAVQTFATSNVYSAYLVIITDLVRYDDNAPTNTQFSEVALFNEVPEPGSLALLSLGGLAVLRRRRRA